MNLSRKAAVGTFGAAAVALLATGMGTAHAEDLYGSMALVIDGDSVLVGTGWNFPDQGGADNRAMQECGHPECTVEVRWSNGCAAIADRDGHMYWALGNSLAEAERNAIAATGPDPNPLLVSLGSADPSSAVILDSQCTG